MDERFLCSLFSWIVDHNHRVLTKWDCFFNIASLLLGTKNNIDGSKFILINLNLFSFFFSFFILSLEEKYRNLILSYLPIYISKVFKPSWKILNTISVGDTIKRKGLTKPKLFNKSQRFVSIFIWGKSRKDGLYLFKANEKISYRK